MLESTEKQILAIREQYFSLLEEALLASSFVFVKQSDKKAKKYFFPTFYLETGEAKDLPEESGIYCIYEKANEKMFYVGESESISRRVDYHFSDAADALRESTLKKYRPQERRNLIAMSEDLKIRYIKVPFGRNDFEEHLQRKFDTNNKERGLQ